MKYLYILYNLNQFFLLCQGENHVLYMYYTILLSSAKGTSLQTHGKTEDVMCVYSTCVLLERRNLDLSSCWGEVTSWPKALDQEKCHGRRCNHSQPPQCDESTLYRKFSRILSTILWSLQSDTSTRNSFYMAAWNVNK